MTEEPRRSGRATKGQHTKTLDDALAPEPSSKTKGKGKASKKAAAVSPEEDEEDEDENIRCVCGETEEGDEGREWIGCDKCEVWQHNNCMGIPEIQNQIPDQYFCERCRPDQHKELLDAVAAGQTFEAVAAARREEARRPNAQRGKDTKKGTKNKKTGKNSKDGGSGKQSTGVVVTEQAVSPETAPENIAPGSTQPEQKKRKHEGSSTVESHEPEVRIQSAVVDLHTDLPKHKPTKVRKASSQSFSKGAKKESPKSTTFTGGQIEAAESIESVPHELRKATAKALKDRFVQLVKTAAAQHTYRIPDGHTADSLGERYGILVEHSLFLNQCGNPPDFGGPYKAQFQAIRFNTGKNIQLFLHLITGMISPDALSKMSSEQMASEELRQRNASMKEESDKQAMLIQEEGSRIRRTHKGEEIVENDSEQFANESITPVAPPRRMHSFGDDIEQNGHEPEKPKMQPTQVDTARQGHRDPQDRRSSSNFNINDVWSNVQSPDNSKQAQHGHTLAGPPQYPVPKPAADADVDRLLEDEGVESAPYSPPDFSSPSGPVWHGQVDMPTATGSQACFKAHAYHVAGSDLGGKSEQSATFPDSLIITGRIRIERTNDYLNSLSAAGFTDVAVYNIVPAPDEASQADFQYLYGYLRVTKDRYGVVGESHHKGSVRELYIVHVEDGSGPLPEFLERLDYNVIERPRPRKMLLAVFVLRYNQQASSSAASPPQTGASIGATNPTAVPTTHNAQPGTPLSHMAPTMSPTSGFGDSRQPPSGHLYQRNQNEAFPPYPYNLGHQQQFAMHNQPPQPAQTDLESAQRILGPHYACPAAQSMLSSTTMTVPYLEKLRQLFDERPDAREVS
ncbi:MAG: hypothetical protein M1831_001486 [Alyxoria varia]|nr:MAG: hypothetical protein M1831_001486 [Alyxoria varia]